MSPGFRTLAVAEADPSPDGSKDARSPVREYRPPGSVRGAHGNVCSYRDPPPKAAVCGSPAVTTGCPRQR